MIAPNTLVLSGISFWEYVDEGHVKISKCSTDEQWVDYLIQGLVFKEFENNRKSYQGW